MVPVANGAVGTLVEVLVILVIVVVIIVVLNWLVGFFRR